MQHASYMDSEGLDLVLEKDIPIVPALTLLVNLLASAGDAGASSLDVFKREVDAASENLGNAFKQGATIISGSETGWSLVPFGEWHAFEMEILVTHLGLSPLEAIHAGTGAAAITLPQWADRIGTLEAGKLADVLVARRRSGRRHPRAAVAVEDRHGPQGRLPGRPGHAGPRAPGVLLGEEQDLPPGTIPL